MTKQQVKNRLSETIEISVPSTGTRLKITAICVDVSELTIKTGNANLEVHIDHLAPALPPEVFYSNVLPDIFSEHLHRYLLFSENPKWNPFYTLPLVSRHFHTSCRALCVNIFGLMENEGGS